jgi:hypothetical protein
MSDIVADRELHAFRPLGVSRPPLEIADLPTPEEVWNVPRVGRKEALKFAVGPSLILLGAGIGSGEWLLGPLNVGRFGFVGIGWIITLSALLQSFYNVECARYVIATGEVPVVGFGRVPPGRRLWIPLSLFGLFAAFVNGAWAKSAAKGFFAFIEGRPAGAGDTGTVELLTFGLLAAVLGLTVAFKRITRGLELVNGALVVAQILFLVVVAVAVVPWDLWWEGIKSFVTPARPPKGVSATQLGSVVGFTALAAGLNWAILGHYRDKGYGMGHRTGFLCGVRGEQGAVRDCGFTFPDDERNASVWRRWMRFLYLDMWGIFFVGAIVGMLLPTILVRHLALSSGQIPTTENVDTFAAAVLGAQYGRGLFYLTLFIGFLILFDTQMGIFELLVRNATDAANASPRLQALTGGDLRRFYFPFMVVLLLVIGYITTLSQPTVLLQTSANMANAAAVVFPFALIYLNRRLPRVARPPRWAYAALLANVVFFGFFFLNFIWEKIDGSPLVSF